MISEEMSCFVIHLVEQLHECHQSIADKNHIMRTCSLLFVSPQKQRFGSYRGYRRGYRNVHAYVLL